MVYSVEAQMLVWCRKDPDSILSQGLLGYISDFSQSNTLQRAAVLWKNWSIMCAALKA